jgi:purine-binding chemotaxis protein CheW
VTVTVTANDPRVGADPARTGPVGAGPTSADPVIATAAALRSAFDKSFAVSAASKLERLENLLAIRIGGDPYVLRLSRISGLYVDRRIVAVPSPVAQLLGIVALRGVMSPVYDLAALLGYPPVASPRWMVFAGGSQPVGLAFEGFEAHVQAPETSLLSAEDGAANAAMTRQHTRGSVRVAGALRLIVQIASVVETIRNNPS